MEKKKRGTLLARREAASGWSGVFLTKSFLDRVTVLGMLVNAFFARVRGGRKGELPIGRGRTAAKKEGFHQGKMTSIPLESVLKGPHDVEIANQKEKPGRQSDRSKS